MGLRAIVMNEIVINVLADRLEKQAGEVALLTAKLAKLQDGSDQYYKWWNEEQEVTAKLEAQVKELEDRVFDLSGSIEAAGLTVEEKPNEVS
jgi:hypothetical protein